jgi:DNA-directed RNA polymerase specialized sigma subunit
MKRRINNIKNELAYFYKVVKNMDIKDSIKQSQINEYETPLDEILCEQFFVDENMDKHLEEKNLLGWIELIENPKLYEAVKELSIEDQIFISYIIKEGLTQRELSIMYGLTQQDISYKFNKLIHSINKILHTT